MSLASVTAAFSVLMVMLFFVTTAILTARRTLDYASASEKMRQETEAAFYLEENLAESKIAERIGFQSTDGKIRFSISDASCYQQKFVTSDNKEIILYRFRKEGSD